MAYRLILTYAFTLVLFHTSWASEKASEGKEIIVQSVSLYEDEWNMLAQGKDAQVSACVKQWIQKSTDFPINGKDVEKTKAEIVSLVKVLLDIEPDRVQILLKSKLWCKLLGKEYNISPAQLRILFKRFRRFSAEDMKLLLPVVEVVLDPMALQRTYDPHSLRQCYFSILHKHLNFSLDLLSGYKNTLELQKKIKLQPVDLINVFREIILCDHELIIDLSIVVDWLVQTYEKKQKLGIHAYRFHNTCKCGVCSSNDSFTAAIVGGIISEMRAMKPENRKKIAQIAVQIMDNSIKFILNPIKPKELLSELSQLDPKVIEELLPIVYDRLVDKTDTEERVVEILRALARVLPEDRNQVLGLIDKTRPGRIRLCNWYDTAIAAYGFLEPDGRSELLEFLNSKEGKKKGAGKWVDAVLAVVPFVPKEQRSTIFSMQLSPGGYGDEHHSDYLVCHYQWLKENQPDAARDLVAYWGGLLRSAYKERTHTLAEFIGLWHAKLQLSLEDTLVQQAVHFIATENDANPKSPMVVYGRLLEKRRAPIHWQNIPKVLGTYADMNLCLNCKGLATIGESVAYDLASAPEFRGEQYQRMISDLRDTLQKDQELFRDSVELLLQTDKRPESVSEEEFMKSREAAYWALIELHASPDSHISSLLQMSPASIESSKLRCILACIDQMEEPRPRMSRFARFLALVRHCQTGQGRQINSFYSGLPQCFQMRCEGQVLRESLVSSALYAQMHRAVSSTISSYFESDSKFVRSMMGLLKDDEMIEQPSHQTSYLLSFIGTFVALQDRPVIDLNSGSIFSGLLGHSLFHALESFYGHFDLPQFLNQVNVHFNKEFKRLGGAGQKQLWNGIYKLYLDKYDGGSEQLESWVTLREIDEVTDTMDTLTPRGTVRILQGMDLLDEM